MNVFRKLSELSRLAKQVSPEAAAYSLLNSFLYKARWKMRRALPVRLSRGQPPFYLRPGTTD
jgi:hypothetical protein